MIRARVALLLSLLLPGIGWTADKKVGTGAAPFLKVGAGARPTAMADSFVGLADDLNSVYFNPAGLCLINEPQLTALHTQWFEGMNYEFGAFALPGEKNSIGFSVATLKVEDIPKFGNDESAQGSFEELDASYGLSWGHRLSPAFSAGVTARYLEQEIDTASAGTWSADFGVLYRKPTKRSSFGAALRHVGQGVQFREEKDPLPTVLDLGAAVKVLHDRLNVSTNLKYPRDNDLQYGLGLEWNQPFGTDIRTALRAGYSSAYTDSDDVHGITLGAGFGFRKFELDFAWVPFGVLGNTFRYAAVVKF